MDYNVLKSAIASVIKQNGNREITGDILQSVLLTMVDSLGEGRQFVGVVTAAVLPLQTDAKVFYLAGAGTYENFGGLVVPAGSIGIIFNSGSSWYVQSINISLDGFVLFGTGWYAYDNLPEIPSVSGKYFITVWRISSGRYYEYLYTSDSEVNGGNWTSVRLIERINLGTGESVSSRRPDVASLEYMQQRISDALGYSITMSNLADYTGSWSDFPYVQDVEVELVPLASRNYPVTLALQYPNGTERLALVYRYESQDSANLVFGGIGSNIGKSVDIVIDKNNETIKVEIYEI